MLASVIINGARLTLVDPNAATWSDAELLGYLNEGERTICNHKPTSYVKNAPVDMVAGTKQALPADGLQLLDIPDNVVSGRAVTLVKRTLLDHTNRFWPAATAQRDVRHYAYDVRDPLSFDICPRNDGTGQVNMTYCAVPPAITADGSINVRDTFEHALTCFVVSRAYAANTDRQDLTKSVQYFNQFAQQVGMRASAEVATTPKPGA